METLLIASNGAMRTEMSLSVRTPWFVGAFVLCAVALVSGDDRPSSASAALTARSGSQVLPAEWYDEDQWHLDVRYLISAQEVSEYKALKTVEAREAFVTRFWTRRDPTPGTARNEFHEEFDRRVEYANAHFTDPADAPRTGVETERGRIYVLFGAPTSAMRFPKGAHE